MNWMLFLSLKFKFLINIIVIIFLCDYVARLCVCEVCLSFNTRDLVWSKYEIRVRSTYSKLFETGWRYERSCELGFVVLHSLLIPSLQFFLTSALSFSKNMSRLFATREPASFMLSKVMQTIMRIFVYFLNRIK